MTEKKILDQIRESSENIELPESISPDAVKNIIQEKSQNNGKQVKHMSLKVKNFKAKRFISAAAVIICMVGISGICRLGFINEEDFENAKEIVESGITENEVDISATTERYVDDKVMIETKNDAGELYVVAENYEDVYKMLRSSVSQKMADQGYGEDVQSDTTYFTEDESVTNIIQEDESNSAENMHNINSIEEISKDMNSDGNYSKTNLQTKGVDESDIVKTDGAYIYVSDGEKIIIADIRNGEIKETTKIVAGSSNASERILEMYVDSNRLNVIVEKEDTVLNEKELQEAQTDSQETESSLYSEEDMAVCDTYYMDSNVITEVRTYDIHNRNNPVLTGSVTQDGRYKTSRKIDNIIYLFTDQTMDMPGIARDQAVQEENIGGWIPLVNGKAIEADCIYLPQQGNMGLVISSINVNTPNQVVDNTLILNNYVDIYVSTDAVYLYEGDNSGTMSSTNIVKFSLKQGKIDAIGAAAVPGTIYDTFAVNDYQGKLRILTTVWDNNVGDSVNNLYLYDKNLSLTGKLIGIAKGEEIYSARYLGDMVYFVTYRNTDPLFAVDLADETAPKIMGALELRGFSEYLHFWGEDKLIGIGYETDPKTGIWMGIKVTMFDISNPAKLLDLGDCVIKDADYSPALYNYKAVLVDERENLVGFATEYYDTDNSYIYMLYSWENGEFVKLLSEDLGDVVTTENHRGIYIDDTFYLVSASGISSYEREDGYQFKGKLDF